MLVDWNQLLFLWLNAACAVLPDWLWASLTITGHTGVLFALFALLLLPPWRRYDIITGLYAAAIFGGIVSTGAKEYFKTLRPPAILSPEQFHLIGQKLDLVSFPSGHTLSAFAAATLLILGFQLRRWRLVGVLVAACLVGVSRVAVGVHWPLDILGGAALGCLCGWSGWQVSHWLQQKTWASSTLYKAGQACVMVGVSYSLFKMNLGQPDAVVWQTSVAVLGGLAALYSLRLQPLAPASKN